MFQLLFFLFFLCNVSNALLFQFSRTFSVFFFKDFLSDNFESLLCIFQVPSLHFFPITFTTTIFLKFFHCIFFLRYSSILNVLFLQFFQGLCVIYFQFLPQQFFQRFLCIFYHCFQAVVKDSLCNVQCFLQSFYVFSLKFPRRSAFSLALLHQLVHSFF